MFARGPDVSVRLTWTARGAKGGSNYFVDVQRVDGTAAAILSTYVARSETTLRLPAQPALYRWRPYAIDLDKRSYSAGAWSLFRVEPAPADASGPVSTAGAAAPPRP